MAFVQSVEGNVIGAVGEWPESPMALNDEAESRLGRLEERWLGLRR
jgi:hypothetical protein